MRRQKIRAKRRAERKRKAQNQMKDSKDFIEINAVAVNETSEMTPEVTEEMKRKEIERKREERKMKVERKRKIKLERKVAGIDESKELEKKKITMRSILEVNPEMIKKKKEERRVERRKKRKKKEML